MGYQEIVQSWLWKVSLVKNDNFSKNVFWSKQMSGAQVNQHEQSWCVGSSGAVGSLLHLVNFLFCYICHLSIILTYWEEDEVLLGLYGDQVHVLSGNFSCFFHPMKGLLSGWNIVLIKNMNCMSPFTNNPRHTVGFVQIRVERYSPKLISH